MGTPNNTNLWTRADTVLSVFERNILVRIGHLHDDVICPLQLLECISLRLCFVDLCRARLILHKRKTTAYNSLLQSILVVLLISYAVKQ